MSRVGVQVRYVLCENLGGMSLNGWQRLWALVAGLWALVVGLMTYAMLPTTVYLPEHPQRSTPVGCDPAGKTVWEVSGSAIGAAL